MNSQLIIISKFLEWMQKSGVERFDLSGKNYVNNAFLNPEISKAFAIDATDITGKYLAWLQAKNAGGFNIFIRPHRHDITPVLLVDDIPIKQAKTLLDRLNSLVVETSPGNCQVWLKLDKSFGEGDRGFIQKTIIKKMGTGDPGSTGGEHFGRLPGFRNKKPNANNWTTILGSTLEKSDVVTSKFFYEKQAKGDSSVAQYTSHKNQGTRPPHAGEISANTQSNSEYEFGLAIGQFKQGNNIHFVEEFIFCHAMARGKHKGAERSVREYARRTALKAELVANRFISPRKGGGVF